MSIFSRAAWVLFFIVSTSLNAGIQPASTRIIYPVASQEVGFKITNNAATPRLIQAWIDQGEVVTSGKTREVPFLVTPPISRLDPDKGQTLRIRYIGGQIPQDRELVFWLNILELPPKQNGDSADGRGTLQFPVRTRLKLFYRPKGLPGKPEEAVSQLRWRVVQAGKEWQLQCENPSAFNVSFHDVQVNGNANSEGEPLHGMCPAKGIAQFVLLNTAPHDDGKLMLTTINDFGGFEEHRMKFSH